MTPTTANLLLATAEGRDCDPNEVIRQLNRWTVLGVSGGRAHPIVDTEGRTVGVRLPINASRCVDIVLDWCDLYTVSRRRVVLRGADRGAVITEQTESMVDCEMLDHVVYRLSCWK